MSEIDVAEIDFDTTDPGQEEAVNNMNDAITNVSNIINDPEQELTEEDTNQLIAAYNDLSEENQQAFVDEIQAIFTENGDNAKFEDLYSQLFTNND